MEICIYCGEPILIKCLTGMPLHEACLDGWYAREEVAGISDASLIITDIRPVEEGAKQAKKEEKFTRDLLVGSFFKNLVIIVLYNAGYEVYPFGWESFLANIKRPLYNTGALNSETAERIRSAPDLVILDRETGDVNLVEVKFRGRLWDNDKADINVNLYRKYWNESVLVLVCPRDEIFYAQFVRNLTREDTFFPVAKDFLPLEEVFKRVSWENPISKEFYASLVRTVSKSLLNKIIPFPFVRGRG